jgi:hypothetical protein
VNLVLLATKWIRQYKCWADFYLEYPKGGGKQLVVQYGDGYVGPYNEHWKPNLGGPGCIGLKKCRQSAAGIPDDMNGEAVYNTYIFGDDYSLHRMIWDDRLSTPTRQ